MLDKIQATWEGGAKARGRDMTMALNSLLHAKPDSAHWNLIPLGEAGFGHAPSKILNRPDLSDDLCGSTVPWLAVVQAMMVAYFSEEQTVDGSQ